MDVLSIALITGGLAILGLTTWDLFWTTLGGGGGPITRRLSRTVWIGVWELHRLCQSHRLLSAGGVITILSTIVAWIVLHWLGWLCLFSSHPDVVQNTATGEAANLWGRIYFVGYVLSTLGIGDLQPRGDLWQFLTALASISGLFQISFSIAYLIPLALAASFKRKVATTISSMGKTADDIILNMWNGENWKAFNQFLQHLTPELALLNHQHLTYPVLHYFHSVNRPSALGPSLATLDEALTIVAYGMKDDYGPGPGSFHAARRVISDFLQTLETAYPDVEVEQPEVHSLGPLRAAGVPVTDDDTFRRRVLEEVADRRLALCELLKNNAWSWDVVREQTHEHTSDDEEDALAEVEKV